MCNGGSLTLNRNQGTPLTSRLSFKRRTEEDEKDLDFEMKTVYIYRLHIRLHIRLLIQ